MNVPILVVDDEPANLLAMEALLDESGIEFVGAASGAQALRHLLEREFALILLDVNMPGLDGYETAALIRARHASAHIPIIFVTAGGSDSARMLKAYQSGAADYVFKPFDPIVLRSKIAVFVALYRAAELKRRAAELEAGNRRLEADLARNLHLSVQLAHQASHDHLTDLPNRFLFEEILHETLALSQRSGRRAAVAFIDLDHFKFINDSYGHAVGDEVLKEAGRRLRAAVRASDVVARIGGDEFVVMLTEFVLWEESVLVAEKILGAFALPFEAGGHELKVSPSIGLALYPDDGDSAASLLKRADIAMYRAKQEGRNCYRFHTAAMSAVAAQQLALESARREAQESEEFLLHYSPKLDLATGSIVGVEALLRWHQPAGRLLRASEFMGLDEGISQSISVGEKVFHAVARQARAWRDAGLSVSIAINLTEQELRDERLLQSVLEALQTRLIEPWMLEFELTEHVHVADNAQCLAKLRRLRELGCKIALDNFGSGQSDLKLLQKFRFDSIKLAPWFISDLPGAPDSAAATGSEHHFAVAQAVVDLARRLGLRTVAQGVVNAEQLSFLQAIGCEQIQGDWISPPQSAELCGAFIRDWPAGQLNSYETAAKA
ncbi:putative bifunctional diguanylate cyclase/phosphodiesterase [Roseateles sp. GG27B]